MKKLCLFLFVACLLFLNHNVVPGQEGSLKPHLFDSYGRIGYEDLEARLDNFAIELQNMPNVYGYVICYGPEGDGSGTDNTILLGTKNYLVNVRGIDADRIQTIYGGRYKDQLEVLTELWIVPSGANPPEPRHYKSKVKTITGKFTEYEGWDSFADGDVGPSLGNVTLAAFADVLRQQPDTLAYIVSYNTRGASPGTWRRVATREATDLQGYGIQSDRIKIIYGGIAKKDENEDAQFALVQLWVLPRDAPPPVKEAEPEGTPKKAVRIGTYNDYLLKYPNDERWVFNGFADVLRANEQLSVCLIARPRINVLEQDVTPDEPPDIDTLELVDKWKAELMEKSGIKEDRIIVIHAAADESREGEVEVWIVPPGADLSDPFASGNKVLETESPQ